MCELCAHRHRKLDQQLPSWTSQQFFERCFFGAHHPKTWQDRFWNGLKWSGQRKQPKKPHPLHDPPCKSRKRPLKWVRLPWHCWLSITTKIHGSLRFKAIKFMAFPWNCKGDGLGGKFPRNMHLITLPPQLKPQLGASLGKALFSSALIGALPGMLATCLALGTGSFFVCLFVFKFCPFLFRKQLATFFHVWPTSEDVKKDLSDPPRTFCNTCGFAAKKRHVIPFSCRAESSATT